MTDLISCVGTMLPVETIRKVPLESYKRIYDINLFSVVSLVQKSIPHLLASAESGKSVKKPSVVIVTSGVDLDIKWHGWSAYCTSKAALTRFIQLLAHEERDLDVYGVLPVVTKSPMVDMIYSGKYDHVMLPEERKNFDVFLRQGKVESPEHIAEAMVKATMGQITPDSPEVERNTDDTLFIRSLYVPEAAPQS
jgi:NAD(P)-dependent dehydrogenase (short-subunit alcohol dehydrogenase family)